MKDSKILEKILSLGRKIIPKKIFKAAQPLYHYLLAISGSFIYGFPAQKMKIILVTGTKGKSTTTEVINSILEEAGHRTVLLNTIRYKIANSSWRNFSKMSTRGRFFIQKCLREGLKQGCTHAVLEVSSESTLQFRHKFLFPDFLIFTNLHPEHIESHGSYENYVEAKLKIGREVVFSGKPSPTIIANTESKESQKFLSLGAKRNIPYSLNDAVGIKSDRTGSSFQMGKTVFHTNLPGTFNISNILGAIACAKLCDVDEQTIKKAVEKISTIRGRMEKIDLGQNFDAVVDYAHTKESLEEVYKAYAGFKRICILGNTGGGRDKWKRPEMGKVADKYCDHIILTNEDPYDEDPRKIVEEMCIGIKNKPIEIIMDRREAMACAFKKAQVMSSEQKDKKVAVLITGKGTDPFIMGPNGTKQEWDDATVAREELKKIKK